MGRTINSDVNETDTQAQSAGSRCASTTRLARNELSPVILILLSTFTSDSNYSHNAIMHDFISVRLFALLALKMENFSVLLSRGTHKALLADIIRLRQDGKLIVNKAR